MKKNKPAHQPVKATNAPLPSQSSNQDSSSSPKNYQYLFLGILTIVFLLVFSYIFDKKHDLNGDNAVYYTLAQALAKGFGYVDITVKGNPPSNAFPPGYPLLAAVLMFFSDSVVAQHILNGVFLLGSVWVLFLAFRQITQKEGLVFTLLALTLFNSYVLRFSTMMMSEMSYLFFSSLAVWAVVSVTQSKRVFYKNPVFYALVLVLSYSFHIRTQGITITVAVFVFFLLTRRWKELLASLIGFFLLYLPWTLRNKALGIGGDRYLAAVLAENTWRPEEGTISLGRLVERFFETQAMLLTKALPDSLFPFIGYDYQTPAGTGEWLIGIGVLAVILYGMWQLGEYRFLLISYLLAVLGIIGIWSAPSGNRYITTIIPFLQIAFFYAIWHLAQKQMLKIFKVNFSPYFLLIAVFWYLPTLKPLNAQAKNSYPSPYANYFAIGEYISKNFSDTVVTCCRKPNLLYLFSKSPVCSYQFTSNDTALITNLVEQQTDLVVLEQLGYSSTGLYLYPAIQKNPELFPIVVQLPNPDTYLLKFEREKAKQKFGIR